MTGGVSLLQITFLGYWDMSQHYHDVVTTCCDMSQLMSRQRCPDKNLDFPSFSIVLSQHPNVTMRHKSIWSNHDVVITSQLRCDYIAMRHDEISTSRYVTTCVKIQKKLKKPNLIIINRVFSRFYKVLYVSYAEF